MRPCSQAQVLDECQASGEGLALKLPERSSSGGTMPALRMRPCSHVKAYMSTKW